MLLSHFPLTFRQTQKRDAPFHCIDYDYSCADWDGLRDHLRDVPWEDIFKLGASAAVIESSESKVKFGSNSCKRVLEAAKLAYANKTKESVKLGSQDFWQIAKLFSTKVNLLYLLYSTARRCFLHLIKQSCLLENFLRTLVLMTQVSLYQFSLLELICNCIIFL